MLLQLRKLLLVEVHFSTASTTTLHQRRISVFLSAVEVNIQRRTTSTAESAAVDVRVTELMSEFCVDVTSVAKAL